MEIKSFFILFMMVCIKDISSLNIYLCREMEKIMTEYNQSVFHLPKIKHRNNFYFFNVLLKKNSTFLFTMETIELPCWNPDFILLKIFNQN